MGNYFLDIRYAGHWFCYCSPHDDIAENETRDLRFPIYTYSSIKIVNFFHTCDLLPYLDLISLMRLFFFFRFIYIYRMTSQPSPGDHTSGEEEDRWELMIFYDEIKHNELLNVSIYWLSQSSCSFCVANHLIKINKTSLTYNVKYALTSTQQ